jgi:trk system potassium uptake protein TrkH
MGKSQINWKQILRQSVTVLLLVGIFMLIPTIIALVEGESEALYGFLVTLALIATYVLILFPVSRRWGVQSFTIREVYLFVTLSWIIASALGALPLYLSGVVSDYSTAYVENMSGFTTTGLIGLLEIETLPRSFLFWRPLTGWIGGMGIVVLFIALLPLVGVEGSQLFGAESVGPTKSKLTPKIRSTAIILWLIYLSITLVLAILLLLGGLSLFDALTITFGTVGTGGFATTNSSIAYYNSTYVESVVTVFMLLGGINFSLYFLLLKGRLKEVFRNRELQIYMAIFAVATLVGSLSLWRHLATMPLGTAVRQVAFQVASIMTTTGFFSVDFNRWPAFTQGILLLMMFVGGSSGSTGGGIKVARLITMFKLATQSVRSHLHPRGVFTIQSDKEHLTWKTVNAIIGFVALYLLTVFIVTLVVASAQVDLFTAFITGLITVGNIGLGFGGVGPGASIAHLPSYVKWSLSFAMLAGRLEIYTVFALFSRTFWRR